MYKKAWCTYKVVVLLIKPIVFFTYSLPSASLDLKLPTLICSTWWLKIQWHLLYGGNFKALSSEVTKFSPRINVSGDTILSFGKWPSSIFAFDLRDLILLRRFAFNSFDYRELICSSHNDGTFELCYVFTDRKMTKKTKNQWLLL